MFNSSGKKCYIVLSKITLALPATKLLFTDLVIFSPLINSVITFVG